LLFSSHIRTVSAQNVGNVCVESPSGTISKDIRLVSAPEQSGMLTNRGGNEMEEMSSETISDDN
jgi:hypothetical protein